MPITGTLTISGVLSGDINSPQQVNQTAILQNAVGLILAPIELRQTTSSFSVPVGSTFFLVIPPPGNTFPYKVGGVSGIVLDATRPSLYGLDTAQTLMSMSLVTNDIVSNFTICFF